MERFFSNYYRIKVKKIEFGVFVAPRIEPARRECEAPSVGKRRNATMPKDLRPIDYLLYDLQLITVDEGFSVPAGITLDNSNYKLNENGKVVSVNGTVAG